MEDLSLASIMALESCSADIGISEKKCRKEALSNVHVVWDQPGVTWATACSSSVAAVSSAFSWVVRASD
jgi:hypothetical protein